MCRVRVLFEREAKARLEVKGLGFASLTDLVKQKGMWVEMPRYAAGTARVVLKAREEVREVVDASHCKAIAVVPVVMLAV